eukprot:CAMPEP_0196825804 /NCGR_PEP_ID=MMETSP1362-20130617/93265_1 /TAXON_ID=163516 /ORGANISM="Leptocylindrus danicus, Strain CCMP1856" /LENGTH=364 /DNA_ID=CAMNT_0042206295 /DNA_START=4875 /DNA_END=5969 /DNA_ORIENTATION=-
MSPQEPNESNVAENEQKQQLDGNGVVLQKGDIFLEAQKRYDDDRLLEAARLLRGHENDETTTTLNEVHRAILEKARDCEEFLKEIKSDIVGDDGHRANDQEKAVSEDDFYGRWNKQTTTSCSGRMTNIYYMLDKETKTQLSLRVDTPIEKSLLIPLLSVLNESELYPTWLPSWKVPRMGIRKVRKLSQKGRVSQIIVVTVDVPWPLQTREVVISAVGVDDIDDRGEIVVRLHSLHTGDENGLVPPPDENDDVIRIDFDGGFVFRKHVVNDDDNDGIGGDFDGDGEDLIMTSFQSSIDSKLNTLPKPLLNFVLRQAFGMMWSMLLRVAEEVRDGKRPEHAKAIAAKREVLYDWVDERVGLMLEMK